MTALLIGIGVLVFIALVVAGVNGIVDAWAQRALNQRIGCAASTAASKLDCSLGNDLGAAGITARMSGLTEFLHTLSSVMASGHRSGLPALALLTAGLLAIGGGVAVVIDRVEDRREVEACVEGAAAVAAAVAPVPPTTTTTAPDEPDSAATGEPPETGEPPPAEAPPGEAPAPTPETAPDATADTPSESPDSSEPTLQPAPGDQILFLTACLSHAGGGTPTSSTSLPNPGTSR